MENVLYLSAALGAAVLVCHEVRNANRRHPLAGAEPFEFVLPVNEPRPFGQQPRGDLSELGGLSQSNHNGAVSHG